MSDRYLPRPQDCATYNTSGPEIVKCRDCVRRRHDACLGFLDDGISHPDSLPLCECDCNNPNSKRVCAWCPQPASGSALHNDWMLWPSCGQADHGRDYRETER